MSKSRTKKKKIPPLKPSKPPSPPLPQADIPLTPADIPDTLVAACASIGRDGRGTGGLQGFLEYAATKHRAQALSMLEKFGSNAQRFELPAYGAPSRRMEMMRGYNI